MRILATMSFFLYLLVISGSGCANAPLDTTEIIPIDTNKPKVGKILTIGTIVDNRFPFWPRKESHPPVIQKGNQEIMIKDFEPSALLKEVRIPMGEVRSRLANALKVSRRFEEIINPPSALVGESLQEVLKKAFESSDYLIVGEVNSFHVKDMGPNSKATLSLLTDVSLLSLPNLVLFLVTGGKSFLLLSGGVFAVHTAECCLTLSLTLYEVESGNPLTTVRLESRAHTPIDAISVYGDLASEEDDWLDIGRHLGDVALANACNQAIDELAQVIQQKEGQRKSKK